MKVGYMAGNSEPVSTKNALLIAALLYLGYKYVKSTKK
jgi:hypothetical protein